MSKFGIPHLLLTSILIIVNFPTPLTLSAQEPPPPQHDELLRSILIQNSAAYNKALDAERFVSFSWSGEATDPVGAIPGGMLPGGHRRTQGDTRIWIKGSNYHQDLNLTHTWGDGSKTDASCIMVLNQEYFARYYKALRLIELYRFESRDKMYPLVRSMSEGFPSPSDLKFGFKAGSSLLQDKLNVQTSYSQPAFRWTVSKEESQQRLRFIIRSERLGEEGAWLREESIVEPTRGYLVSEHRWFDADGSVRSETRTALQQINSGFWFPKSTTTYKRQKNQKMEYTFHEVELDVEVSEDQFRMEAMEFDRESVLMKEIPRDGRGSTLRGYFRDVWIPLEVLPEEHKGRLLKNREHLLNINGPSIPNPTGE